MRLDLFPRKYQLKSYFFTFIFWIQISNLLSYACPLNFVILLITFIWRELCLRIFIKALVFILC